MALEFTILGEDGAPKHVAPVAVDAHWEIVEAAERHRLRRIGGCREYHEDHVIRRSFLSEFRHELGVLRARAGLSPVAVRCLEQLEALTHIAQAERHVILALAD